jgi:hypothetical protein
MVNSLVEYMNNHKEKEKTYDEFVCNRSMDNACKKKSSPNEEKCNENFEPFAK